MLGYIAFLVGLGLAAAWLTRKTLQKSESDDYQASSSPEIKIVTSVISHFQSISFIAGFDFEWPDAISDVLSAMAVTSGNCPALAVTSYIRVLTPHSRTRPNPDIDINMATT